MATNPYVNKVEFGGNTVIDISSDDVTPNDVLNGVSFHDRSGAPQTGNLITHDVIDNLTTYSASDALSAKQGYILNSKIELSNQGKADIQDLMKDTVGWTCKNKLPLTITSLKAINTSGTWSGNAYTIDGVTFTVSTTDEGYVTKVNVNGTASADTGFNLLYGTYEGTDYATLFPLGSIYLVTGCASDASDSTYYYRFKLGSMYVTDQIITENDRVSIRSSALEPSRTLIFDIRVVSGVSVSNKEFYPQWIYPNLEETSFEPYHESVKQTLRDAEVIEGKNLLEITAKSQTINGVTLTVNGDGSVKINGTASALTVFELNKNLEKVVNGEHYILTGCPSGGGSNSYRLEIRNSSDTIYTNALDEGSGSGDIAPTAGFPAKATIRVASGYTASNVVFYPMLRYASEADPTFEPYYIPLKDSKFDRAEQRVLGAKNLLKYPYYDTSKTENGVTFTDNGNGTITANGTASAQVNFGLLPNRTWNFDEDVIISGAKDGTSTTYEIMLWDTITNTAYRSRDNVDAIIPSSVKGHTVNINIVVRSGAVLSNKIFYPMLRLASDPDDTYVPYSMTNKELTDAISSGLGHTMIPDPIGTPTPTETTVANAIIGAISEGGTNDDVISGYGVGVWSNTDTITLMTTVSQGDTEMGTWEADDTWETSGVRTGWLQHAALHGILSAADKDDYEISLVFDVASGEAISCLAYRIDDAISSSLGGIAIKFNAPIKSVTASVGVVIKHNRTKTFTVTRT